MRWIYMAVIVLGLIAATSAAVLVAGLREQRETHTAQDAHVQQVTVVKARRDLKAMTVVKGDAVEISDIPQTALPEGAMSTPEQVIGKVLAFKVNKGQAFTRHSFVSQGSGPQMAAILTDGKRAVSVSLPPHSGLRGLLYPGCLVDVLLSTQTELGTGNHKHRDLVSVPLLQGIQVLAVGNDTVFAGNTKEGDKQEPASGRRLVVTLLVEPEQAQALQLGQERGMLTLAMRNPFDMQPVNTNPLQLQKVMAGTPYPVSGTGTQTTENINVTSETTAPRDTHATPPWEVMIIRGGSSETETFDTSADQSVREEPSLSRTSQTKKEN